MKSKLITFVMGLLLTLSAWAVDSGGNSVYIDQTNADNSTVTITQTGSNNTVGDPDSIGSPSFVIDGNAIELSITQDGMNNSLKGNFVGNSSTGVIVQQGNGNGIVLNYGAMGTDAGTLGINLTGSNNSSTLNIGATKDSGNYNYSLSVIGDSNTILSSINSKNTTNSFTLTGNSNNVTTTQTGANGTYLTGGHNIQTSVIGSNNDINISQSGVTNPNSAIVNLTGNGASVSITQH